MLVKSHHNELSSLLNYVSKVGCLANRDDYSPFISSFWTVSRFTFGKCYYQNTSLWFFACNQTFQLGKNGNKKLFDWISSKMEREVAIAIAVDFRLHNLLTDWVHKIISIANLQFNELYLLDQVLGPSLPWSEWSRRSRALTFRSLWEI